MSKGSKMLASLFVLLLFAFLSAQAVDAGSTVALKKEMRGSDITTLQTDLKKLGFMSVDATGYFGAITEEAVISLQKKYGLEADGIAGAKTLGKIESLLGRTSTAYRGSVERGSQQIVNHAKKFLGVRYVWGGSSTKGFDCSGFTKHVFKNFGVTLNRVSASQAKQGTYIKKANLLPGDLVFFDTNGGLNKINHVGIYIGNGRFIHSSSSHSGVVTSSLSDGFYAKTYMTARRVSI